MSSASFEAVKMRRHRFSPYVLLILLLITGMSMLMLAPHPTTMAQDAPTSTPDAEGVIYTVVAPNDSLWAIADGAGISLQELLSLNGLAEDAIIHPGQLLIVGHGSPPPAATVEAPTPTTTTTRPPPSPTSTTLPPPRTAICLEAFADTDGDGIHDGGEPLKAAVAFTVFNEETVVGNYITDGVSEPHCIEGLAPGDYKVTRSVRRDETLTTSGDWVLTLTGGSILNLEFGSYSGVAFTPIPAAETVGARSELAAATATLPAPATVPSDSTDLSTLLAFGFIIVLLIVIGGGLVVAARARRTSSRA